MKKLIVSIGLIGLIAAAAFATDWSNPHPQSGGDSAGQLVLKHELNMTDLYQASTGKLNYLKGNFSGAVAPSGPNTGQAWYDSTNKLFKIYDSSWGGGGFYSTATSSFTGPIVSSGTNTFSGTQNVTGAIVSSGTNTFSGLATFTGGIVSTGTMTGNATTLTDGTNNIKIKVVNIGDWNMDSTVSVDVPHGLTLAKIRSVSGVIRNDTNDYHQPITPGNIAAAPVYIATVGTNMVSLYRATSGIYDSADYDSTSYNRGWLVITYVE